LTRSLAAGSALKKPLSGIHLSLEEKTFPLTLASLPKKIRVAHLPA